MLKLNKAVIVFLFYSSTLQVLGMILQEINGVFILEHLILAMMEQSQPYLEFSILMKICIKKLL